MDTTLAALTALLLDPCLTVEEAEREAAATVRRDPRPPAPRARRADPEPLIVHA